MKKFLRISHKRRRVLLPHGDDSVLISSKGACPDAYAATCAEVRNSNPSGVRGCNRVSEYMKALTILIVLVCGSFMSTVNAQTRTDSEGNVVHHPFYAVAQYQMGDFEYAKLSSSYGFGIVYSSISHWGRFHVGANLNLSINAGVVDDWGMIIDFGPSARIDIVDHFFVNIPVNVVCGVTFPEGSTESHTTWGGRIPVLANYFFTERFGLYAGPQLNFAFTSGSSASIGMQCGIAYAF